MDPGSQSHLITSAEERARHAESLSAFPGFSLVGMKRVVSDLLGLIGRSRIFDEYTVHDITHINQMLGMLEWIVPAETQESMTATDWLMITLAIYFHDMGMVVTEREFERRAASDFEKFKQEVLFAGDYADDYRTKIEQTGVEAAERFFYQEFVRHNHAKRIRRWLGGEFATELGEAHELVAELARHIGPLGPQFAEDLGVICESHHLDDLDDLTKYRVARAYGPSDQEVCNVQYAAIILRTADLLHMTHDRVPSVTFRVTNPLDPISQREWTKQMGVKRVCSKLAKDVDGIVRSDLARDTIEIHAYFTEAEPYFALTSLLRYVEGQLQQSHRWAEEAKRHGSSYSFPWRRIDYGSIETKGFLPLPFSFQLDQPRILSLLTGHTLYNDASVAIRELVQNALDAVRLRRFQDEKQGLAESDGMVRIDWDSVQKILSVTDNGVGMTQDTIERFFLTVGTSIYTDERFVEEHPGFSSISRFGIGILATFMIADYVDVYSCHKSELLARQISLRGVQGQYLIRLLDKKDTGLQPIVPSGTKIQLRLRVTASDLDVAAAARHWVMMPDVPVYLAIDGGPPERIGFESSADALQAWVAKYGNLVGRANNSISVQHSEQDGLSVAFLTSWSDYFQDSEFATLLERGYTSEETKAEMNRAAQALGTAVHGIRVESGPPGFSTPNVLMMVNATGMKAPKTNVARSSLEDSAELRELRKGIYATLVNHVVVEQQRLHQESGYSLSWSMREAEYLLANLLAGVPHDGNAFTRALREANLVLFEEGGARVATSIESLASREHFWTVESRMFRAIELVLSEAQEPGAIADVAASLGISRLPDGPVLCSGGLRRSMVVAKREIQTIRIIEAERRVDLKWVAEGETPRWIRRRRPAPREMSTAFRSYRSVLVAVSDVNVEGMADYDGVVSDELVLIFADTPFGVEMQKLVRMANSAERSGVQDLIEWAVDPQHWGYDAQALLRVLDSTGRRLPASLSEDNIRHFLETRRKLFWLNAWSRVTTDRPNLEV